MSPVDNTPTIKTGSFELLYSSKAYNKVPVFEYQSKTTGLTVVFAEVDGPVVNGYFCVVTEAFDDDGLPHTLEHLIFLGSEDYPYKGVLDLLANRCLASGTNAWTDIDHTCYTMETAGSEGFLALMPIFLEHILHPILTDEGFITEVHHITPEGDNAGVVYCEMQGRENAAESRLHYVMGKKMYPGKCGYSSETGGIMKNLRESTTNEKVRKYHHDFYRPENLKIIICGQVKHEEAFKALAKLEEKIVSKGDKTLIERPWQSPVPPLEETVEMELTFPTDDENNGIFAIAWRGASAVSDQYTVTASSLLLKYLSEFSVSPLQKEFVEIDDPYASKVTYNLYENSSTCLYLTFEDVPVQKLSLIKEKLLGILKGIVDKDNIDMQRMESIINRHKLECLSNIENTPHNTIAYLVIAHMLYGNNKDDLEERVNPLENLSKLLKEPKSYWLQLMRTYFVDAKHIAISCVPSKNEQLRMALEEKKRVTDQVRSLGSGGLKQKEEELNRAIEHNEKEPTEEMLTCVPIPTLDSIEFHNIRRYRTDSADKAGLDLSSTPIYTFFDDVNTNFVYIFGLLDTSKVPSELRIYIPLLLEVLLELPINKDGKLIPYEQVVHQLNDDTVANVAHLGLAKRGLFKCGSFSHHAVVLLQVEGTKFETGLNWLHDILYNTVFTAERLEVVANKMINAASQVKRSGREMCTYAIKSMWFIEDSNIQKNGLLLQNKFLGDLVKKLGTEPDKVIDVFNVLRGVLTNPNNFALYLAGNLKNLPNPAEVVVKTFKRVSSTKPEGLTCTPDYKLLRPQEEGSLSGCIISMGCLESSFFLQATRSISDHNHPDLPALMLYLQYLTQAEGPLWKQIRGKGYSYGYAMRVQVTEGLLYLIFTKATNIVGAYRETEQIVTRQLETRKWDKHLLDAAKSSLIFEIIDEETTIGNVVNLSVSSYFQGVDYTYNRTLLTLIQKVTVEDLNKVGEKYVASLFDSKQAKTAIVTDPAKAKELAEALKSSNLNLTVYPSLEESFLKIE